MRKINRNILKKNPHIYNSGEAYEVVIPQNQNWALQITNEFEFMLLNSVKTTFPHNDCTCCKVSGDSVPVQ